MAVVKYGAIITEIKGKVGGTVFQGGRSGGTAKNKGITRGTSSATFRAQDDLQHANFSNTTKLWQQLLQSQRDSFSSLLGQYTFKNKFGETYNGTGYQIFCSQNLLSVQLGLGNITDAQLFVPTIDAGLIFSDFSIGGDWTREVVNALPVKNYMFVEASQIVLPNTSISKLRYRKAGVFSIQLANVVSIKAEALAYFGATPPLGSVFYLRLYYTRLDFIMKQFAAVYKINVVA